MEIHADFFERASGVTVTLTFGSGKAQRRARHSHHCHAADTNPSGDIFGGWVMSQWTWASAILCLEDGEGACGDGGDGRLSFLQPVGVGDTVACYAWVEKIGRSSMKIPVEVWCSVTGNTLIPFWSRAASFGLCRRRRTGRPIPVRPRDRPIVRLRQSGRD